ncbi:extracellular solute-binding protein [bacterium]|nr:extracellular solute-binding protein [bacterium]
MKKRRLLLLLFGLLPLLLFAEEEITLKFWEVGSVEDANDTRVLAAEFYAQTGIRVEIQIQPWGNFQTKYMTALAAGLPPDIGVTNSSGPGIYGSVGGVIDLQAHFPEAVARIKDKYYIGPWTIANFRGHQYGIPAYPVSTVIYYRKDIFAKLGLQPPETWSEFKALIKILNANEYQYGFGWGRNNGWALGTFLWPYDEQLISENGTKLHWTAPGFRKGFTYAMQIWNRYNISIDKMVEQFALTDTPDAMPLYSGGMTDYFQILLKAPHIKDKMGIAPFPKADDGKAASYLGGTMYCIFRDSKHYAESMQWIEFLCSKHSQRTYYDLGLQRGARSRLRASLNKAFWEDPLPQLPPDHQRVFHRIMRNTKSDPHEIGSSEIMWLMERYMNVIAGESRMYLGAMAAEMGLSSWELRRDFARDQHLPQREKFYTFIDSTAAAQLALAQVEGQAQLEKSVFEYDKYFSLALDSDIVHSKKRDILDYAKLVSLLLVLTFILLILIRPGLRKHWRSYLNIAPPVSIMLVFLVIPLIVSIFIAFTKYNPILPLSHAKWVGFSNFADLLQQKTLWQSLGRSFYYALMVIPIQLSLGVVLAVCLDQKLKVDRLFKFIYFSPLVTSVVSISLIWFALYMGTKYGWMNSLLIKVGFTKDPLLFMIDKRYFLNSVIVMSIWQGLAFQI